jgi:hypothetical protein
VNSVEMKEFEDGVGKRKKRERQEEENKRDINKE